MCMAIANIRIIYSGLYSGTSCTKRHCVKKAGKRVDREGISIRCEEERERSCKILAETCYEMGCKEKKIVKKLMKKYELEQSAAEAIVKEVFQFKK